MKKIIFNAIQKANKSRDKILNNYSHPIIVLMYHRILPKNNNKSPYVVTRRNFDEQINYLRENFTLVMFDDDWSDITTPSFVITFDDGYFDNYLVANKYAIPMTFFISTGNIETKSLFWWDELSLNANIYEKLTNLTISEISQKLINSNKNEQHAFLSKVKPFYRNRSNDTFSQYRSMTKDEIFTLSQNENITIGAHTVNHLKLTALNDESIKYELQESKKFLEEIIRKKVTTCSFPYGYYNQRVIKISKKLGFKKAATTQERNCYTSTNPMKIPRIYVSDDSISTFKRKIEMLIRQS